MRTLALSAIFAVALGGQALAWGQEGHSIIAEIAQRRLSPEAARSVEQLLGRGHSLASVASWADDVRDVRPETSDWHFVDMPLAVRKYNPSRDCAKDPKSGFCIVAELDALRNDRRNARRVRIRSKRSNSRFILSATSISRCTPSATPRAATTSRSIYSCVD
jgi:nuclease S1